MQSMQELIFISKNMYQKTSLTDSYSHQSFAKGCYSYAKQKVQ